MPPVSEHPSPETLAAFINGRLTLQEQSQLEEHVADCETCLHRMAKVPDDTLLSNLRNHQTRGQTRGDETVDQAASTIVLDRGRAIPAELVNHPRYRVIEFIGAGGMGDVFLAEHRLMERKVALKVLHRRLTSNPNAIDRFRFEVRAAGKLTHPNIVTAYDADQAGDLHFLAMEYVDGISLDRHVQTRGVLTVRDACNVIRQAAEGLRHAHEKKMVHRDIKPANLMAVNRGPVKILDFGLARFFSEQQPLGEVLVEETKGRADLTADGLILGTPDYIAPEQVGDAKNADIRADIYSLGCTFYYLLTGRPPFATGSVAQRLRAHRKQLATPLAELRPDVPPELVAIVEKMMEKKPADRFQDPKELVDALKAFRSSTNPTPATAVSPAEANDLVPLPALDALGPDLFGSFPATASGANLTVQSGVSKAPVDPVVRNSVIVALTVIATMVLFIVASQISSCSSRTANSQPVSTNASAVSMQPPDQQPTVATLNQGVPTEPKSAKTPVSQPTDPFASQPPIPVATAAKSGKRVLYVLPSKGVYLPDYEPVRQRLEQEAGITVEVASSRAGPCYATDRSRDPVQAQYGVADVDVSQYDAIVFGGLEVRELCDESAGNATKELINSALQKQKLVSAICGGQIVLVYHGILDGRSAARPTNPTVQQKVKSAGGENHPVSWKDARVQRDGRLITAADQFAASEFAEALISALNGGQ